MKHVGDHLSVFFFNLYDCTFNAQDLHNAAARFLKRVSLFGDIRIKSLRRKSLDKMQNRKFSVLRNGKYQNARGQVKLPLECSLPRTRKNVV